MNRGTQTDFTGDIARALVGAIDWWQAAGIDCAFADEPHEWLSESADKAGVNATPVALGPITPPPAKVEPAPIIGGDAQAWPTELHAFQQWWLTEASLDQGQVHARVPPRGPASPQLMVLVSQPESEDGANDSGHLLSGPQGRLLSAMLATMGLNEDQVYVASCLPRHTPVADWAALADSGLGALLNHHIALVAPPRLLVLGGNVLPLLGHDPAQTPAVLPIINQKTAQQTELAVPILAAPDLGVLLKRPAGKARLWQDWLEWSRQS